MAEGSSGKVWADKHDGQPAGISRGKRSRRGGYVIAAGRIAIVS